MGVAENIGDAINVGKCGDQKIWGCSKCKRIWGCKKMKNAINARTYGDAENMGDAINTRKYGDPKKI